VSSIDPSIAAAQAFVQAAESALADAALNLGAQADAIVAQLHVGDLLPALVLPAQNGTDRLEIFGQPVAAQLPPGIHPGETIVLQVNAFDGNKILVSNLGVADPEHPPALANVEVPAPPPGAPSSATLTKIPPPAPPAANAVAPAPAPPRAQTPPVAPPHAVFVAASVRPAPQTPAAPDIVIEAHAPVDIEARMAAIRTAPRPAPNAVPKAPASPRVAAPRLASPPPAVSPARAAVRPPVTQRAVAAASDDVGRLLARLRVPQTPLTAAAARIVKDAVAQLPRAFARLDALLPKTIPEAAAPLRSLLAFVGKIDLENARALPEQIASFVSHVVDGAESKLAQALASHRDAEAPAPLPGQTDPHARAAERATAADFDLKTALAALAGSPAARSSPQLSQAVADALAVATGVQLGALASQANDPSVMAIALPAFYHEGGRPVRLTIARDAPGGGAALDPDNFRIGFVLDTKTLGTLAIDVETVGRSVKVDVKTEGARAARQIAQTLPELRARFEHLRYRVAAIAAGVAPAPQEAAPVDAPAGDVAAAAGLDLRA